MTAKWEFHDIGSVETEIGNMASFAETAKVLGGQGNYEALQALCAINETYALMRLANVFERVHHNGAILVQKRGG